MSHEKKNSIYNKTATASHKIYLVVTSISLKSVYYGRNTLVAELNPLRFLVHLANYNVLPMNDQSPVRSNQGHIFHCFVMSVRKKYYNKYVAIK